MVQGVSSSLVQSGYGYEVGTIRDARLVTQAGERAKSDTAITEADSDALTAAEQQQVQALEETDRAVRAHEQAHLAVGGDLVASGAVYSYETGPDRQRYAVAGEVTIDTAPARTPDETIPKAQHIRETALAPADPSSQDRSVAAQASRMEGEARRELSIQRRQELLDSVAEGSRVGANLDLFA